MSTGPSSAGTGDEAERSSTRGRFATIFAEEYGRCVATLVRVLGDIDLAEDAVQDAMTVALTRWPVEGVPANAGGWIVTTARRRALDRLRREAVGREKQARAVREEPPPGTDDEDDDADEEGPVRDDRLRLIFTCCHPALAVGARVALTLRLLGGLSTPEIAKAFLVPEATMAQRIVRAKHKIKAARIPYRVPHDVDLPERLPAVLAVVYLVFTEGHATGARADLCGEAIRLGRLLAELMPDEPEVLGLLALMLLAESRRPARTDATGARVLLADQDRTRWDRALIDEGQELVRRCLRRNTPGPYQVHAAIQAVHSEAAGHGVDRLGADRRPARPAARPRAQPDGRAQPGGGAGRDRGAGGRARDRRRPRRAPRAATTCCTPPARTCCAASVGTTRHESPSTRRSPAPRTPTSARCCTPAGGDRARCRHDLR